MASRVTDAAVAPLQDPVTGTCYDDIVMVDTTNWQWTTLQVAANANAILRTRVSCSLVILSLMLSAWLTAAYLEPLQCNSATSSSVLSEQHHISTCTNIPVVLQITGNKPPARHSHSTGLMQKNLLVSHSYVHQS